MSEQIYPGPNRMVKIDGARVKSLRESKGLTQLYIATVVGVTTDTISRWENKRYPSIKEENAIKLAEALEVELEQLLEKDNGLPETQETAASAISQAPRPRSYRLLLWLLPLVAVLLLPFIWYNMKQPAPVTIYATRLLPPHTPPGQPFPVIIQVTTMQEGPFSLIVKEMLPRGCEPIVSAPPFTSFDRKTETIKWISRTTGQAATFVYLAKSPPQKQMPEDGASLRFSGTVTLRDEKSAETAIAGSQVLPLANYHWADTNKDSRIDDAEILAAYDIFSGLDLINYDWQELDAIWSGSGYDWDPEKHEYIIRQ